MKRTLLLLPFLAVLLSCQDKKPSLEKQPTNLEKGLLQLKEWNLKAAEQFFLVAHNKDDATIAAYYLSRVYRELNEKDKKIKYAQKAVDAGHAMANVLLASPDKEDSLFARSYIAILDHALNEGDFESQVNLGWMYQEGKGVVTDREEALKWYKKAAEQGYVHAQYNLGRFYFEGERPADKKEAIQWYRKAAAQGHARAQYNLGWMYDYDEGITTNKKEAIQWYRKAAAQGDPRGQGALGVCYYEGQGVAIDKKEAVKWYRKAAAQGEDFAQYNLGLCYLEGQGVAVDKEEAVKWIRKAAEQGNVDAQAKLGLTQKKRTFYTI